MNIYINDVPITKEQVNYYLDQLKEVFPLYFDKKNPKPVIIEYRDDLRYQVRKRREGKGSGHMAVAYPLPQSVKCIKFARNDSGTSDMYVMTRGVKETHKKTGEPFYPFKDIMFKLENGKALHNSQDNVELIFWYFFSGKFINGKVQNPRGEFTFTNPMVESKKRIEDNRERFELQASILYGGLDVKDVERYLTSFGLEVTSFEDMNRTALFDYVTTTNGAKAAYYSMVEADQNSQGMAEAMGLVREAMDRGKIGKNEDGWAFVGKNGLGRAFAPDDSTDPIKSLSKLVVSDENLKARFEKALATVEV